MKYITLVLVVLAILAFSQAKKVVPAPPATPELPYGFAASMLVTITTPGSSTTAESIQWYHNESVAERFNVQQLGNLNTTAAYTEIYVNFTENTQTLVSFEPQSVTCEIQNLQRAFTNIFAPFDLSKLKTSDYVGTTVVYYQTVRQWQLIKVEAEFTLTSDYYTTNDKQQYPVQLVNTISYTDVNSSIATTTETFTFLAFGGGNQDPRLFKIPEVVQDSCSDLSTTGSPISTTGLFPQDTTGGAPSSSSGFVY